MSRVSDIPDEILEKSLLPGESVEFHIQAFYSISDGVLIIPSSLRFVFIKKGYLGFEEDRQIKDLTIAALTLKRGLFDDVVLSIKSGYFTEDIKILEADRVAELILHLQKFKQFKNEISPTAASAEIKVNPSSIPFSPFSLTPDVLTDKAVPPQYSKDLASPLFARNYQPPPDGPKQWQKKEEKLASVKTPTQPDMAINVSQVFEAVDKRSYIATVGKAEIPKFAVAAAPGQKRKGQAGPILFIMALGIFLIGFIAYLGLCSPSKPIAQKGEIAVGQKRPAKQNRQFYQTGVTMLKTGNYHMAISAFTNYLIQSSNDAAAYYYRGQANQKLYLYRKAAEDYRLALNLSRENHPFFKKHPRFFQEYGEALKHLKEFPKSLEIYSEAERYFPNNLDLLFEKAYAYTAISDYQNGTFFYAKYLQLNPSNKNVYNNRALGYERLGQTAAAIKDYEQAIALDPAYKLGYTNYIKCLEKLKRYKDIIHLTRKGLAHLPDNYDLLFQQGYAYLMTNAFQLAEDIFTKMMQQRVKDKYVYLNRGWARHHLRKYPLALVDYSQAIKLDASYKSAYVNRGYTYYALRKYREAIEDFSYCLFLSPQNSYCYYMRGRSRMALGLHQEAQADLARAKSLKAAEKESP